MIVKMKDFYKTNFIQVNTGNRIIFLIFKYFK